MKFRVSSALKDLIGKELITDQYIAIFELVKNSFDAYSRNVSIIFEDIYKANPRIIIRDDGKGMNDKDLINKWLFVAYSAKRDGTEDNDVINQKESDYRDKIKSKRAFAGAKGVGRFSCDRLGSKLKLFTTKEFNHPRVENLCVDWEDFEQDGKKEFINIGVDYNTIDKKHFGLKHGTILEISDLRDKWNRDSILKLKASLEKLINPNQQKESVNFSINIICKEEQENDLKIREEIINKARKKAINQNRKFSEDDIRGEIESNIVNGNVKNTIFETLGIKSTQIISSISSDGKYIETILKDRGLLIYKIKEKNIFQLSDIIINLFFLNSKAKLNFTRLMGVEPVKYGSVFVYKNGFRVYPFGQPGEDIFNIDKRKAQGYNRYIGTRELMGRIEITGNDDRFKETTSRDGGFIINESYEELSEFFLKTVRRLERYIVDIIKWGTYSLSDEDISDLNDIQLQEKIKDFIRKISNTNDMIDVEFNNDFMNILNEKQKESLSGSINELKKHAVESKDYNLVKKIDKIDKEYKNVIEAKTFAETDLEAHKVELKNVAQELKQKTQQNLFLKSVSSLDLDNIVSLHHQIGIYANDIDAQLLFWNRRLQKGKDISADEMRTILENIGFLNKKILSITKFATKANFNLQSEQIEADLLTFIEQYISNIYILFTDNPLNIEFINEDDVSFVFRFKPIEISIVIDNLISNSRKFNAKNVEIKARVNKEKLELLYIDDGDGVDNGIQDTNSIFEKGFSTTSGSGLGLYHVKQILSDIKGSISILPDTEKGLGFLMEVVK